VQAEYGCRREIGSKPPDQVGVAVRPRRRAVERTVARLSTSRRLSKEYDQLPASSEAWIYAASIHLMLRRLARV
jgi:putative transposase